MNLLEQAGDSAITIHVDFLGRGHLGQTGHGHDVAGKGHNKARSGTDLQVADRDGEALRSPQQGLVVREGVLGFGHADGQLTEAQLSELLDLLFGIGGEDCFVAVIHLLYNSIQLLLDGGLLIIDEGEPVGLPAQPDHLDRKSVV